MSNFQWMLKYSVKMDSPLRRQLISTYEVLRNYPCFLQKQVRWVVERLSSVPVIIQFQDEMTDEKIAEVKAIMSNSSFADARMLPLINGMATKLSLRDLQNVCDSGVVSRVTLDREVKALLDNATSSVGSRAAHARGITGRGVTVAVIDTGIYPHPDVYNQIIGFKDFINNRRFAYDDNGHGTHCAGDVAGNGTQSTGRYVGTAPEARLVGVKVLNSIGSGSLSTVIQGIDWCVQNRQTYGIRVISMSLGSQATTSAAQDPVVEAVERAWTAGIVVCVAAGNDGPDAGTIASPGISRRVITVGAADDRGTLTQSDDEVADFSSGARRLTDSPNQTLSHQV